MPVIKEPIYSSYLQILTSMLKTSMLIPRISYQYIGQSGAPPTPPHQNPPKNYNVFGNSNKFGGGFNPNSQASQIQPN